MNPFIYKNINKILFIHLIGTKVQENNRLNIKLMKTNKESKINQKMLIN